MRNRLCEQRHWPFKVNLKRLSSRTSWVSMSLVGCLFPLQIWATPTTHSWAPSTDVQANRTFHLTSDFYFPSESDAGGSKPDTITFLGLTTGYWPIEDKFGMELGFDHVTGLGELDDYPIYFNTKIGTPENALFDGSPALAFGGYGFGTERNKTDQDILYIKSARTVSLAELSMGRFSFGWFWGNPVLLLDDNLDSDANGIMLTWERTMSEISDKLWLNLDYQGSDSGVWALMPAFAWKFAENVSVIFGYVIPNNSDLAESVGIEVDIDFGAY